MKISTQSQVARLLMLSPAHRSHLLHGLWLSSGPITCAHPSSDCNIPSSQSFYPTLLFITSTIHCLWCSACRLYFQLLFPHRAFMWHLGWISAIFHLYYATPCFYPLITLSCNNRWSPFGWKVSVHVLQHSPSSDNGPVVAQNWVGRERPNMNMGRICRGRIVRD